MSSDTDLREQQLRSELRRLRDEPASDRLVQAQMQRRANDLREELEGLVDRRLVVRSMLPGTETVTEGTTMRTRSKR